ncbi:eukaryotic translation initiation factor 5B-like [Helianthus annuus]|uniref:eukaryotic translation initiation factor 5B-like n=1 Tax=Helianthus annuus TaxID=4232 RepID=UPI000B8F2C83|nr:eukaryotic translation initiation factor 5B-like [Helianthus annuus]
MWTSKKSPPRLLDEPLLDPAYVIQQGVESAKEKDAEGVAHTDSSDADDESTDTESEIDKSKISVGKITLKKKPQKKKKKKKKKGSDEEDETYIPTPQAEKKKGVLKRKANPQGVISRRVRARKGSASVPKIQSGKSEKHVKTSKGPQADKDQNVEASEVQQVQNTAEVQSVEKNVEKKAGDDDEVVITGERVSTPPPENPTIHIPDDAEMSKPKKTTPPGLFEGFPNIHGEFKDDILPDEDYDMFHDAKIKDLSKKVSLLEKEKAKAEAEHDELKKQLEKTVEVNEEMKSVVNDHAERIDALTEDLADNAKLIDQLTTDLAEVNAEYENLRETSQTLHQMLDDLHEVSSNENKVLKLKIEALRADKAVKDEQLNMLYTIQRVEERRAQWEKELAEAATQKKKDLIIETQEAGGSSSQPASNDVEMVDAEVDPLQSFVLVGEALSRPYNLNDVIRMIKVEQRKGNVRAVDVNLLCYKEDKEVNEEEEEEKDEELERILEDIDNYPEGNDDDEDQGATGLLMVKPSVQQSLDDFLNDENNESRRIDQVSSMVNSDKITNSRDIDDATHANDATIVNLNINRDDLQALIDAAVGKAMRQVMKKFKEPNATCSKSHLKRYSLLMRRILFMPRMRRMD